MRPGVGAHIHPPLAPGLTHVFQGRGPGGREPDKENATYGAFGHGEPGLDRSGPAPGPRSCPAAVSAGYQVASSRCAARARRRARPRAGRAGRWSGRRSGSWASRGRYRDKGSWVDEPARRQLFHHVVRHRRVPRLRPGAGRAVARPGRPGGRDAAPSWAAGRPGGAVRGPAVGARSRRHRHRPAAPRRPAGFRRPRAGQRRGLQRWLRSLRRCGGPHRRTGRGGYFHQPDRLDPARPDRLSRTCAPRAAAC